MRSVFSIMLKAVELYIEMHEAYVDGSERNSREYTNDTTDVTANRGRYHHNIEDLS
ncbi:MAG: hypothetical protein KC646_13455 [Candidatus Cloacimonetes bacterium]|nr:hypothetical protein [Candidatus Cloacimonadota bacterium]